MFSSAKSSFRRFRGCRSRKIRGSLPHDNTFVQRARAARRQRDLMRRRAKQEERFALFAREKQNRANNVAAKQLHRART